MRCLGEGSAGGRDMLVTDSRQTVDGRASAWPPPGASRSHMDVRATPPNLAFSRTISTTFLLTWLRDERSGTWKGDQDNRILQST